MNEEVDPSDTFRINARKQREARGWSQSELARRMNKLGWKKYNQVTVARTEEGTRVPRLDEALTLARALMRNLDDLLQPSEVAGIYRRWEASRDAFYQAQKQLREATETYEHQRVSYALSWVEVNELLERHGEIDKMPEAAQQWMQDTAKAQPSAVSYVESCVKSMNINPGQKLRRDE